jgi:galactokinase
LILEEEIDELKNKLSKKIGCPNDEIQVVYSPLRVCPLGAHVDHQDGLVTGMTLNRPILLAFVPRDDGEVRLRSCNFDGVVEFDIDDIPPMKTANWGNYISGAVVALKNHPVYGDKLRKGIDGIVKGSMPIGGLSSSAAVGIAYLLALEQANKLVLSPQENIELDRYIENGYLGLKNGVLDPSIILLSDRDQLTYLDCQSMCFQRYPTAADNGHFEIVVAYSGLTEYSLLYTNYNGRVAECQEAARRLLEITGKPVPESPKLRMVPVEAWEEYGNELPTNLQNRATHFFEENKRVGDGISAWIEGDLKTFGRLISESGESSVKYYECGCPPLTDLFYILTGSEGVYGARFSGAGFRGSCIGIIHPEARQEIQERINSLYLSNHPEMTGLYSIHFVELDGPARIWNGN